MIPQHPRPVISTKAVATQAVQQRRSASGPVDRHTIVVEPPAKPAGGSPARGLVAK